MIAQVVLASVDSTLIEAVTGIIRSIAHLELKVLPQLDETLVQLAGEKVSLLLVHLQDGSDIGPASRLLQRMPTSQHVAATVVVSDRPHAEQELILLRRSRRLPEPAAGPGTLELPHRDADHSGPIHPKADSGNGAGSE